MPNTEMVRIRPFDSLRQMRTLMDRMFPWNFTTATDMPAMVENLALDVYDEGMDLVIRAAMPGIKPEDVKITFADGVLEINADYKDTKEVNEKDYYLKEYSAGTWHRSLRLPANVVVDKATAKCTDGFLTLRIPHTKDTERRTVEVKVS